MSKLSQAVSLHPYFQIHEGKLEEFLDVMPEFLKKTSLEPGCIYYDFFRDGQTAYCREAYLDAEALLAHLANVGDLVARFLELSELKRIEVHGPSEEIEKLREPMEGLHPEFFIRETGLEIPCEG